MIFDENVLLEISLKSSTTIVYSPPMIGTPSCSSSNPLELRCVAVVSEQARLEYFTIYHYDIKCSGALLCCSQKSSYKAMKEYHATDTISSRQSYRKVTARPKGTAYTASKFIEEP